jgi:diguanylate cyclase (GGDEF)-like protein
MTLHLPTLLYVCIAVLAMSAGVMTLFGVTQRSYRGFWWWTAAQWLLTLGLLLQTVRDAYPSVLPLSNLLMLQWPIVVLAGMRRFYARGGPQLPAITDWMLLTLAYLLWLASWASHGDVAARVAAFSAGALALHLYGAVMLTHITDFKTSTALKALACTEVLAAGVQGLRLARALFPEAPASSASNDILLATGLVVAVSALVMVYLALLLNYERTERNLRAMHRKLRFLADIDVLTRVPNRRHFHELAAQALATSKPGTSAVMMFDIDHFKRINDLLGHANGDEALRQVAHCVRDALRDQDVAGRLGGDEFAVLLPETTVNDAMAAASRIVSRLGDRQIAPQSAPVSLSFGVVQMKADETVAEALNRADQALYEAKRQGRSRAVVAIGPEDKPVFGESRQLGLTGF